jgi:hypothetical protein
MTYNDYFLNVVPKDVYAKLNKDKSVNYHFRSDNVGKCAKIYDDFRKESNLRFNKKNWERYYFTQQPKEPLQRAAEHIAEKYDLDIIIAKKYVHYRVIGQTWNGMMIENNVIRELEEVFLNIWFEKAPYEIDEQYFTDWEAWNVKLKRRLFGIQIKPLSYDKMNTTYQLKAKENHQRQADAYTEKFQVPHIVVFYDNHKIHEKEELINKINTILVYNIKVNL